jgi:hypothetical protein
MWLLVFLSVLLAGAEKVAVIVDLNKLPDPPGEFFKTLSSKFMVTNQTTPIQLSLFCQLEWLLTWTPVTDVATIELATTELRASDAKGTRNWGALLEVIGRHVYDAHVVYLVTDLTKKPERHLQAGDAITAMMNKGVLFRVVDQSFNYLFSAVDLFIEPTLPPVPQTTTAAKPQSVPVATTPAAPPVAQATTSTKPQTAPPVAAKPQSVPVATTPAAPPVAQATTAAKPQTAPPVAAKPVATTPASPPVNMVKVVGHIYLSDNDISMEHVSKQRIATVRGYAGIIVTLKTESHQTFTVLSNLMGEFTFENVTVGPVSLVFNVPPGLSAIPEKKVALRAGGVNRIPPVELKFDENHQIKINPHVKSHTEWSSEGITVVVLASVLTLAAIVWVTIFCIRQQKQQQQGGFEEETATLMMPIQQKMTGHHGLKKRV